MASSRSIWVTPVADSITTIKGETTASNLEFEGTRATSGLSAWRGLGLSFCDNFASWPAATAKGNPLPALPNSVQLHSPQTRHYPFFLPSNDDFKNLTSICPSWPWLQQRRKYLSLIFRFSLRWAMERVKLSFTYWWLLIGHHPLRSLLTMPVSRWR